MGRCWLVLFILLAQSFCFAKDEIYFSDSEKASIALLLKASLEIKTGKSLYSQADYFKHLILKLRSVEDVKEPRITMVNSFEEFLELQKNSPLFAEYQLSELSEVKLLENTQPIEYRSPSFRVQKKIEAYEAKRISQYQKFLMYLGFQGLQLAFLEQTNIEDIQTHVKKSFEEKVQQLAASLSERNTAEVIVLSKLLKSYFNALPTQQKAEILYRLSQISLNSAPTDIFLVMIQNAGPQMQKLVQIMGRSKDIPEAFKVIFQKLESQVTSVPWWKVKQLLELNGVDVSNLTYFEREPIGVGTMAQTHRIQYTDKYGRRISAVLRFLKPNIDQLLEMDHQILIKISSEIDSDPELQQYHLPSLADLVEDLHRSVAEELVLGTTIQNQIEARRFYSRSEVIAFNDQKNFLQIMVPDAAFYGTSNKVMIQDLVFGQKPVKEFSQYKEIYPDLYRVVSERLAEMWIDEAFFKSGFFHADLHQGNVLADVSDSAIRLSILDYGMVGHLSTELKESALLLALGVNLDRADLIAHHYLKLSKSNNKELTEEKFVKLIEQRLQQFKKDPSIGGSFEAWTAWALDQGIELNYEFLKLNRGLTAIQGMLTDSKSDLSVQTIARKMAFRNKKYVAQLLLNEPKLKLKDLTGLALTVFEKNATTSSFRCENLFK